MYNRTSILKISDYFPKPDHNVVQAELKQKNISNEFMILWNPVSCGHLSGEA